MLKLLKKLLKSLALLLLVVLLVMLAAVPLARMESPDDLPVVDNGQALAIDNLNLVTMRGGEMLREKQLLIRNGLIEDIRPAGSPVSDEYRVIDAEGAWAMPGLFDMHVHAMDRKYLVISLAQGVTSVRNMGGYPMHLRWKRELANREWLGSNLFSASPTMNGKRNANPLGHKVFTDPDKARAKVREYQAEGWDFLKLYARLETPVYEAIIDEAAKLDFPAAGHVPYPVVEHDYTLARHMVTLEHTEDIFQGPLDYQYDDAAVQAVAAQLADLGATVTPTLMIFDHLTRIARQKHRYVNGLGLDYLNPLMKFYEDRDSGARWLGASEKLTENLEKRNRYFGYITRVLHENGVNLVLGSDSGVIYAVPGWSTHEEIALLQTAGIPNQVILEMGTIRAARVLGVDDRLGTIETGKAADLLLAPRNPLNDATNLRIPLAVVKDGQWLGTEELRALRASARNPSSFYRTMGRILEFVISG